MNKELATNPSPCIRRMTVLFLTGNLKKKMMLAVAIIIYIREGAFPITDEIFFTETTYNFIPQLSKFCSLTSPACSDLHRNKLIIIEVYANDHKY